MVEQSPGGKVVVAGGHNGCHHRSAACPHGTGQAHAVTTTASDQGHKGPALMPCCAQFQASSVTSHPRVTWKYLVHDLLAPCHRPYTEAFSARRSQQLHMLPINMTPWAHYNTHHAAVLYMRMPLFRTGPWTQRIRCAGADDVLLPCQPDGKQYVNVCRTGAAPRGHSFHQQTHEGMVQGGRGAGLDWRRPYKEGQAPSGVAAAALGFGAPTPSGAASRRAGWARPSGSLAGRGHRAEPEHARPTSLRVARVDGVRRDIRAAQPVLEDRARGRAGVELVVPPQQWLEHRRGLARVVVRHPGEQVVRDLRRRGQGCWRALWLQRLGGFSRLRVRASTPVPAPRIRMLSHHQSAGPCPGASPHSFSMQAHAGNAVCALSTRGVYGACGRSPEVLPAAAPWSRPKGLRLG